MELPKIMKSEHGGMLDGIKSKLGFADARAERDDYGDYGDDYGDYGDDYGDYGPEHDDDSAPASRYDPYAPVTTRPARRSGAHASRSSSSEFPKLVSIDDVRANTQVPDSLRRDPLPPRRVTGVSSSSYRGERTVIDTMSPAPSSPAHTAARREPETTADENKRPYRAFRTKRLEVQAARREPADRPMSIRPRRTSLPCGLHNDHWFRYHPWCSARLDAPESVL